MSTWRVFWHRFVHMKLYAQKTDFFILPSPFPECGCLHHSPNAAAFTIPRMRLPSPFPECGYQFVDTNVRYRFLSYNNMSRVVGARFIAPHGWGAINRAPTYENNDDASLYFLFT